MPATFVVQTSGIRSTAFDKFGMITAVDNLSNGYKATRIQVANRASKETGQFGFTLLPGVQAPIKINFNNIDSLASSLYGLTVPFADEVTRMEANLKWACRKLLSSRSPRYIKFQVLGDFPGFLGEVGVAAGAYGSTINWLLM